MASVPRLDKKWDKVEVDLNEKKQSDITNGCVYYARCPLAEKACATKPVLLETESDHFVACTRYMNK